MSRSAAAVLLAAAAAALAPVPAPAAGAVPLPASCRKVNSKVHQANPVAPLVVGDSVTVSAGKYLGQMGFSVDAVACRSWVHGLEVLEARRLPDVLVVALGSNGELVPEQLERTLDLVGPFGRLVLVLPKSLGGRVDPDGRLMRAFAEAHPDQVGTLDWPGYSAGESGWFQPDGLHLTTPGAQGFARMIGEGVEFGPPEEVKPPARPRAPQPEQETRQPPPRPQLADLWRSFGHAVAAVVGPPLRLLGKIIGGSGELGRQDL